MYTIHVLGRWPSVLATGEAAETAAVLIRHSNGGGSLYFVSSLASRCRPYFGAWTWWPRPGGMPPFGSEAAYSDRPEVYPLGGGANGPEETDNAALARRVLAAIGDAPRGDRLEYLDGEAAAIAILRA